MAIHLPSCLKSSVIIVLAWCVAQTVSFQTAGAQQIQLTPATSLVVDGSVESVFQSGEQYLVQILVQRSEVPQLDRSVGGRYPAPGEYVYVHVDAPASTRDFRSGTSAIPQPRSRIRAFLSSGTAHRWQSEGRDWFQENPTEANDTLTERSRMDRGDRVLGLSTERVSLGRESALKVVSVTPNSPAANAGIEPGDILVKANGIALESDRQLAQSYRESGGQFALTVRDVRSGRDVLVNIESDGAVPNSDPSIDLNMKAKPLGVTTALAFYGGEPVLKVTEVASGSPAERAGITIGLLILKANGQPTSSEEKLREAERGSRGRLELQVVDPSDRRERTVRVTL